jgi:formylglycine-generating enzyme required for sulfatase activity
MPALPVVCLAVLCFRGVCVAGDGKKPGIPSWAKVSKEQVAEARALGIPVAFENDFGVKFVLAPRGTFMMGSPDDEVGRYPEEGPRHKVTIGKAYYISIHQTTQGQWKKAMGTTPWDGKRAAVNNPDHAVNHVTWDDAVAFCATLKKKDGRSYRLPTEAEWEYACRAGTTTRYCYGDDLKAEKLGEYAWFFGNWGEPANRFMHRVGQKKPNHWGLYDMHGNAWEFCMDVLHRSYEGAPTDGSAWTRGGVVGEDGVASRVLRGGGMRSTDRRVRAAGRISKRQNISVYYVGFRIVCEIPPKAGK